MAGSRGSLLAALLSLSASSIVAAQPISVGQAPEDYLRVMQILGLAEAGSFTQRSLGWSPESNVGPWAFRSGAGSSPPNSDVLLEPIHPRLRTFGNSRFPVGRNDGAVWQGRGLSTSLDGGATARWRALTVTFNPAIHFAQNTRFQLAPVSLPGMPIYSYPWRVIDWPQRFGPDPLWELDPGQSEIRVDAGGASFGASTANLWWGPGIRNAIVLSNNAPGFPHAFIGTDGQRETAIGGFEARWIFGYLSQSDWFDPSVANTDRFITGIAATYSPSFLGGLSLGFTRMFYGWAPESGVPLGDHFAVFTGFRKRLQATPENPTGDDEYDQMLSLFGRWVLPESGFEVYWEWARNDHSWEVRDFLLEPEHSQAYTMGLRKAVELDGNRILALTGELTHLEKPGTLQVRVSPTYYEHWIVLQGYTHRGQVIGAGIGPGGNSQFIGADLYAPWGKAGAYFERQVHDNDAYYAWAEANDVAECCHDVSFHLGAETLFFVGDFDLGGGFIATREYNRYFFGLDLWNLNLSFSARWRPD